MILCRVEGRLHALDALCPHEGGRIVPGPLVEGKYALCPLHNYKFDPRTGKAVDVSCKAARTYRAATHLAAAWSRRQRSGMKAVGGDDMCAGCAQC